jgi:hypothetical protein
VATCQRLQPALRGWQVDGDHRVEVDTLRQAGRCLLDRMQKLLLATDGVGSLCGS